HIKLPPSSMIIDNYGSQHSIFSDLAENKEYFFDDGRFFLAHEASLSFELWTGIKLLPTTFLAALNKRLN
ncbi:MAG: hypothetical protein ACRCTY_08650, partial [Candidatus Adiutrix sp.]